MGVLMREFAELYRAEVSGESANLPELPAQYADYAVWQRRWLESGELDRQLKYWREKLRGPLPVLNLPLDQTLPISKGEEGASISRLWPSELTQNLMGLSRQEGSTLYMTLLAGLNLLLFHYTGQTDLIVGTDVAGRRPETEPLIGFFVNQLVLRADLTGNPSFRALLRRVRQVVLEAYLNQDLPFDHLVTALGSQTRNGRQSLFTVKFVLQNAPIQFDNVHSLNLDLIATNDLAPKFDLLYNIVPTASGLLCAVQFDRSLFNVSTVNTMVDSFIHCLTFATKSPDATLTEILESVELAEGAKLRAIIEQHQQCLTGRGRPRRKAIALPTIFTE
jgi:non-ribosomal peptide synthetase component F